ncbi:S-adenosyl-L-methionine-dependent methyltransferase [Podospora aff. communis PSN243]|uniref:S-adenosyl-L-methionine-dependent methyltransferase n=1 Tax=Podospora aff. communis PSN243 TaxID=3040156 RepID=A0AAV9H248_9PEZI|nr:S-adenosyl-L-methionine-dependent methyltransferase [Podospora aff. communis PSN243]
MFLGMAAAFYTLPFAFEYFNPTEKKKPNAILPAGCCAPTGRPVGMDITRAPHATPRERRDAAEEFDRGQNFPEWLMGITAVRKTLGVEAEGDVLELAVGTGRNLGFYVWEGVLKEGGEGMRSYTGVDISGDMVGVARDRLRDAVPGLAKVMRRRRAEGMPEEGLAVEVCNGKVRLFVGDAEGELPAPPGVEGDAEGRYDTVIQTFGLCSVAEPKRLLENAARAVKPDTGRIILVEHGRGTWEWFNEWFVDRSAQGHFDTYGCWWNRDIEAAVREAEKTVPGLEVVALKRPGLLQFGTLFLIELRVNSKKIPGGRVTGEKAGKPQAAKGSEEPKRSNWWFGSQ